MNSDKNEELLSKSMLSDNPIPWRSLGTSLIVQVCFGTALLAVSMLIVDKLEVHTRYFRP
jgi:hypothetical protein